jgi:hypothetical protein
MLIALWRRSNCNACGRREYAGRGDADGAATWAAAAADWLNDPQTAIEIEGRLARGGFDNIDINAHVFLQTRKPFAMFDHLMQSAQTYWLMREISVRREFARRVGRVIRATDGL